MTPLQNMYAPFRGAPDICPGIANCGYLTPVTTKKNPRSMVAVWATPSSQLTWATNHVDTNHADDLTDSSEYYAIIKFEKGTVARKQFTLFGGRARFHSNFRSALTFCLCLSVFICKPRPAATLGVQTWPRKRQGVTHTLDAL